MTYINSVSASARSESSTEDQDLHEVSPEDVTTEGGSLAGEDDQDDQSPAALLQTGRGGSLAEPSHAAGRRVIIPTFPELTAVEEREVKNVLFRRLKMAIIPWKSDDEILEAMGMGKPEGEGSDFGDFDPVRLGPSLAPPAAQLAQPSTPPTPTDQQVKQAASILGMQLPTLRLQARLWNVEVQTEDKKPELAVRVALKVLGREEEEDNQTGALYLTLLSCVKETASVLRTTYKPKNRAGEVLSFVNDIAQIREGVLRTHFKVHLTPNKRPWRP